MLEFLKRLMLILKDERGEDNPAGAGGQGDASADGGEGTPPAGDGSNQGGESGQAGAKSAAPATPAFGDFGDTPKTPEEALALAQKIYEAHGGLKKEFDGIKSKTAATERNLSLTRKALEGSGIRAVQGEDGNIRLEVIEKAKPERKVRFNDEAIGKLAYHFQGDKEAAKGFVDVLRAAIQDEVESWYDQQNQSSMAQRQKMQALTQEQASINSRMLKLYPQVDPQFDADGTPKNPNFNKAFYERATAIWEEKYNKHPLKEIYAAMDAADELGINASVIQAAKKEGFEAGKTQKKILGPAGSSKSAPAGGGKLSKEEYLKLSPEDREKYDKQQLGI